MSKRPITFFLVLFLAFFVLPACVSTKPQQEITELSDPRIIALQKVSISLEDLPPELDFSAYPIEYDVIEIDGVRYISMSQEEFQNLNIILTSSSEHITLLRSILREQTGLIERALGGEEMAEPSQWRVRSLQMDIKR